MTHPLAEQLREQSQYGGIPADAELTMLKAADLIDALTGQEGAAPSPRAEGSTDNGNPYIFCDYVSREMRGCIRGAGHNGPHVFAQVDLLPLAPVLVREPPEGTEPAAQREGAAQEPQAVCNCTVHRHCPRCHGIQMEPGYGCLDCGAASAGRGA